MEEVEAMLKSFFDVSAWWFWWICLVGLFSFVIQKTVDFVKKQTSFCLINVDFFQGLMNFLMLKIDNRDDVPTVDHVQGNIGNGN